MEITNKDCNFVLLTSLPNGNVHQVLVTQEELQKFVQELGEFKVIESKIEGIKIDI